jgi:TPP-dependent trihydroxycyclohexane-1,2-dione (THcHDO) dehydratase
MRMTMAQALVKALAVQRTVVDGREVPLCAGVWAIFGHGNVAGLGEALAPGGVGACEALPTLRAHNESAMGFAAAAFARQVRRRRFMACTTSIGPGATNLVTAAALAHVNRLPVLFLPGDVFANRAPDPVLQQVEDFSDLTVSANDCLRPVSRLFDRITRPEQLLTSLPAALAVLTDPAACGPVRRSSHRGFGMSGGRRRMGRSWRGPRRWCGRRGGRSSSPGAGCISRGPARRWRISPCATRCRWWRRRPGAARCRTRRHGRWGRWG